MAAIIVEKVGHVNFIASQGCGRARAEIATLLPRTRITHIRRGFATEAERDDWLAAEIAKCLSVE